MSEFPASEFPASEFPASEVPEPGGVPPGPPDVSSTRPTDQRPTLRIRKANGNGPGHGTWVLVPPVCYDGDDPYEALRRDCARLAASPSPASALLRATLRPAGRAPHRVTFEHLAVRLLDAVHLAAVRPVTDDPAAVASPLDAWLRSRLRDVDDPSEVVSGVLAAAEAAHCQTAGRNDVTTALLAVALLTEVFCRGDERFPWQLLDGEVSDLCRRRVPAGPPGDALRDLVTAHARRDAAFRCLDVGDGRRAVGHAAAARAMFRRVGCGVDAAGCDVLEAMGLLGNAVTADGAATGARAAAVTRLERARSVFAEFAFDGHAAHCAIVLGAIALDERRFGDAAALASAAFDASRRSDAPARQTALAAELHGDALSALGDRGAAADWYRRAAVCGAGDGWPSDAPGRSAPGSGETGGGQPDHEPVDERSGEPDG